MDKICRENLHSRREEEYGPQFKEHALEQYKVYIRSIDYTSSLKHRASSYFLTTNTIFIAAVGLSFTDIELFGLSFTKGELLDPTVWQTVIPVIGTVLCIAWWHTIRAYKRVNQVKFHIMQCLEDYLPFAPYKTERKLIDATEGTIAILEPLVPWIFVGFYVFVFFFAV